MRAHSRLNQTESARVVNYDDVSPESEGRVSLLPEMSDLLKTHLSLGSARSFGATQTFHLSGHFEKDFFLGLGYLLFLPGAHFSALSCDGLHKDGSY